MKWLPVLQIFHRWVADYRHLCVLTLPDKIRHREVAKVEISISLVLSDGIGVGRYRFQDAWRDNNTPFVVEEYGMLSVAVVRPRDMADRVEWPGYIGDVPPAANCPCAPSMLVTHSPNFSITSPPAPGKCLPLVFGVTLVPAGKVFGWVTLRQEPLSMAALMRVSCRKELMPST